MLSEWASHSETKNNNLIVLLSILLLTAGLFVSCSDGSIDGFFKEKYKEPESTSTPSPEPQIPDGMFCFTAKEANSPETCTRIFKRVFDCCLPGYCNAQPGLSEAVSLLGCFQCLYIVAKSGNEQNTERALKLFREHL